MKKFLAIGLVLFMWSCIDKDIEEGSQEEKDEKFVVDVPADFDWSNISGVGITVNVKQNGASSTALDNTVLDLYDEDGQLLDAMTVIDGSVEFNVRVPASASKLTITSQASGKSIEITPDASSVNFEAQNISAMSFARVDTDGDEVYDQFDADPLNSKVTLSINNFATDSELKSTNGNASSSSSYVIFEDLWPSKGDYDFNDLVCKTTFSWTKGKSNYIEEISGVCEVEWIGAGMQLGLGFELFEMKGTNLYYLGNVITAYDGCAADNSVPNGYVVFDKVQSVGINKVEFSINIEEKEFKSFLCVPYLFRTSDPTHQVRPFGAPPTKKQKMSLFRSGNDASPTTWSWNTGSKFKYPLSDNEAFYRSAENHPWGIEFISKNKFKPSKENKTILKSYPGFREWAETGGKKEKEWYDEPAE